METAFLEPTATVKQIADTCSKAIRENHGCITVPPLFVKKAKELLEGRAIKLSTVIGFPYGWSAIESKVAEVILAMIDGADELDIVINIIALKNHDWQYLAKELNTLMTVVRKQQRFFNIIIEAGSLSDEDLTRCCDLYGAAGIDCLVLSTGTGGQLPLFNQVRMVRRQLADKVGIKIYAANADAASVELYRDAGASRIGILVK